MGDVFENRQAEELVHGRIHRLQTESESPQSDLGDVGEPVQRFTIATTAIATPQEFGWRGYEIELAVDSTPGVAVGVAFSRADADTGRVQRLYPGERFSSVRPFRRVWIVSVGDAGSVVLHLTRVSLTTRASAPSVVRERQIQIYQGTPTLNAVMINTGPLSAGLYDLDINWRSVGSPASWLVYYRHHYASTATKWETYEPLASYAPTGPMLRRYAFDAGDYFTVVCAGTGAAGNHSVIASWGPAL